MIKGSYITGIFVIIAAIVGGLFLLIPKEKERIIDQSQTTNVDASNSQIITGGEVTINNYSEPSPDISPEPSLDTSCMKIKREITSHINRFKSLELSYESKQHRYIAHLQDELTSLLSFDCEILILDKENKVKSTLKNAKDIQISY